MKKKLICLLLSLVIVILAVSPVLAASSVTITVVNTGSAYTMIPISVPMSNSSLASGNFITVSGLDVLLSGTIPCMLADTQTLFAAPVGVGVNPFYYTTGNTPLTSMPIIVGNGGYITTTDNAALEPGTVFSIVTSKYVDTTAGSGDIITKTGALHVYVDGATNTIVASIPSYTTLITTGSTDSTQYSVTIAQGQTFTTTSTTPITQVELYNSSTSFTNVYAGLYAVSAGAPVGTPLAISSLVSSGGFGWVKFPFVVPYTPTTTTQYAVLIVAPFGTGSWDVDLTSSYADGLAGYAVLGAGNVISTWTSFYAGTADFFLKIDTSPMVAVTGVSPGVHTVTLSETAAASGTLTLTVDTLTPSTITGAGSVPNTANAWIITPNPYMNYYKETVGATEVVKYQPNTIIIGTALPNLDSGGAYPGVITFGTNPAGITTSLGALLATASSASSSSALGTPNLIPDVALNAKITGGNSGTTFPLYALFSSLLNDYNSMRPGSTPIPMAYFWRLVAAIIAFLFGTGVLVATKSMMYGAIAYGLGLLVPTLWLGGVFDWWVPVFYIIGAVVITMLSTKWTSSSIV